MPVFFYAMLKTCQQDHIMRKLYKPGDAETIYGIGCDWKDVADEDVDGFISSGWYLSPLDFDAEEKPAKRKPKAGHHGNTEK